MRRCTTDLALALVTISGSGPCRKARISGVVGLALVRGAAPAHRDRQGCRGRGLLERSSVPRLLAARIAELAHAEEGEVVVAQPFEEGDRLGDGVLVERHRRVAEFRDRVVEPGKHRLPVADRRPHLRQQLGEPFLQPVRLVGRKRLDVDVDDAERGRRRRRWLAAVGQDLARRRFLPCRTPITGWVTRIGSPAVSVISPSTESNRNGMLSLTTVMTVTGRPLRTMAGVGVDGDDALALAVVRARPAPRAPPPWQAWRDHRRRRLRPARGQADRRRIRPILEELADFRVAAAGLARAVSMRQIPPRSMLFPPS